MTSFNVRKAVIVSSVTYNNIVINLTNYCGTCTCILVSKAYVGTMDG